MNQMTPSIFSARWWLGTAANLLACAVHWGVGRATPLWLDRVVERLCVSFDWREDPIF